MLCYRFIFTYGDYTIGLFAVHSLLVRYLSMCLHKYLITNIRICWTLYVINVRHLILVSYCSSLWWWLLSSRIPGMFKGYIYFPLILTQLPETSYELLFYHVLYLFSFNSSLYDPPSIGKWPYQNPWELLQLPTVWNPNNPQGGICNFNSSETVLAERYRKPVLDTSGIPVFCVVEFYLILILN